MWFTEQDTVKGPEVRNNDLYNVLYVTKYRSEYHLPFENSLPLLCLTKINLNTQPLHLANQPHRLELD